MSPRGFFLLADSAIRGDGGHHREYALHVLQAALDVGLHPVVFAATSVQGAFPPGVTVVPAFADDAWVRLAQRLISARPSIDTTRPAESVQAAPSALRAFLNTCRVALLRLRAGIHRWRRTREFRQALTTLGPTLPDLVFVPSASGTELGALNTVFHGRRARCLRVVIRRLEDLTFAGGHGSARAAVQRLADGGARFYCDTQQLCTRVEAASGVRPALIPIPVPPFPPRDDDATRPTVAYLGDARIEKGFLHLPGIVRALIHDPDLPPETRFVIQGASTGRNPAEIRAVGSARQALRAIDPRRVTVIADALPTAAYHRLLQEATVVILPYDAVAYADRSSGVFADALASGVAPVVPDGTWMASELRRIADTSHDREAYLPLLDLIASSSADFPTLAKQAIINRHVILPRILAVRDVWAAKHSSGSLLQAIGAFSSP
jgi:hypothetical protein